jgi:hypothetical protein
MSVSYSLADNFLQPSKRSHCSRKWNISLFFAFTVRALPESESYVTTDGQPASLSWNKAPFLGLTTRSLLLVWQVRVCWFWAHSLTRGRVCRLQLQLDLASAVIFGSESHRTHGHILLSHIWDFHFRRLLRLAGSRWMYSTPPPHGSLYLLSLTTFSQND